MLKHTLNLLIIDNFIWYSINDSAVGISIPNPNPSIAIQRTAFRVYAI